MTRARTDPGEFKGHRWFAAAFAMQSRLMERRLGPVRAELLAGLRGDVLELGAGTGANFRHYTPEARVIAVEPDPYMLRRAEAEAVRLGARHLDVRRAPAEHLPFDDDAFDAVVATLVLCTVRDVPQALAEARRVLRPGGEVRFLEHVRSSGAGARVQDTLQPVWGWFSGGCHWNRETERAIADAGFRIEEVRHTKLGPLMPAIVGTARAPA